MEENQKKVSMLPAYISTVTNKLGSGSYFSLDMGGTNIRFIHIVVEDSKKLIVNRKSSQIPSYILDGECDDFCDFIAGYISVGMKEYNPSSEPINCFGLSLSFPCSQKAINHGSILKMGKAFKIKNAIGEDVISKLKKACASIDLDIKDFALINDVTGTLLYGSFEKPSTYIGLIIGTGTNSCYVEETRNVEKSSGDYSNPYMIIYTEWGAFGEDEELKEIQTDADLILDRVSANPKMQIFEKMVSGMYISELVRVILVTYKIDGILFANGVPEKLLVPYALRGEDLAIVCNHSIFVESFQKKYQYRLGDGEYDIICMVCQMVVDRAATLVAIGLNELLNKVKPIKDAKKNIGKRDNHDNNSRVQNSGSEKTSRTSEGEVIIDENLIETNILDETDDTICIAVDGSMIKYHPDYLATVTKVLKKISTIRFEFLITSDGSGKGSALAAYIMDSQKRHNHHV
ncbi:Hexokinase-1 [Thelohanellus kitauei]|uniref:Phosphotransferase n=1 Tax=Thelohanellus kitauei TaxID=669202 RepID=A0A0C2I8A5_THEKT|nr:Hexokinase-1 [Thelohanellus kitauei]